MPGEALTSDGRIQVTDEEKIIRALRAIENHEGSSSVAQTSEMLPDQSTPLKNYSQAGDLVN